MNANNYQWVPHSYVSQAFSKRFYNICKILIPYTEINIDWQIANASLFFCVEMYWYRELIFSHWLPQKKPKLFSLQWEQLN